MWLDSGCESAGEEPLQADLERGGACEGLGKGRRLHLPHIWLWWRSCEEGEREIRPKGPRCGLCLRESVHVDRVLKESGGGWVLAASEGQEVEMGQKQPCMWREGTNPVERQTDWSLAAAGVEGLTDSLCVGQRWGGGHASLG